MASPKFQRNVRSEVGGAFSSARWSSATRDATVVVDACRGGGGGAAKRGGKATLLTRRGVGVVAGADRGAE